MSKRTLALIIVLIFVTAVLIVVAVYSPTPQPTPAPAETSRALPTPTPAAQTTLSLLPNPIVISSQTATTQVAINSQDNKITAVQLELLFDPKKIKKLTITPGLFFENPVVLLNSVDTKEGRVSYAIGISPTGNAKMGQGIVANISFQTNLAQGEQTSLTFLPKTLVTAEGIEASVLKSITGTTILFTQSTESTITPPMNTISQ